MSLDTIIQNKISDVESLYESLKMLQDHLGSKEGDFQVEIDTVEESAELLWKAKSNLELILGLND